MPVFTYIARNNAGDAIQGKVEAGTEDAVATQLINSGITPIEINQLRETEDLTKKLNEWLKSRKPKIQDLIFLTRQMYTLMRAGVPIVRAINGLADNMDNPTLVKVLKDIAGSLESGRDLSTSFAKHPKIFSHLFVSMIRVGESTGELDGAFLKLSEYLEREKDTRDRIKQAMRYPIIVISFIVGALTIINLAVIPKFEGIFEKFGADLPWQTKLLIGMSDFMITYWPLLLGMLIGGVIWFRYYIKTDNGRHRWDRFKLRIPLVGSILYEALLARFATAFALTMRSGVRLVQGLHVTGHTVANESVGRKLTNMRVGIERGDSLTRTAAASDMFTPLTIQMLQVGEETGAVDDMLDNVAHYYDREVDYKLKNLSSAIEPILIIIVGAMVFMLALGVFLPMWELGNVVK